MAERTPAPVRTLRLIGDDEVALESARARALTLYKSRYSSSDESVRAMVGALRAIARIFNVAHESAFDWECLADPALVSLVCAATRKEYGARSVNRIQAAIRRILRCCVTVGLISGAQAKLATEEIWPIEC